MPVPMSVGALLNSALPSRRIEARAWQGAWDQAWLTPAMP
jgi:hypothetical protein